MSTRLPRPCASGQSRQSFAYGGLLVFTVLLYLRPNEWLPHRDLPDRQDHRPRSLVAFFVVQISEGRPLSIMPREFKLLLGLTVLMVLSIPLGMDAGDSFGSFHRRVPEGAC